MKKIITLSILVLTAFACKKEEVKPETPATPISQSYPALHAGTGMWNMDLVKISEVQNPSSYEASSNAGTIQFVNDTVMIVTQNGYSPNEVKYKVNAARTVITLYADNTPIEGPMTWTNANKMKFSYESTEGSTQLRATYELTRQ